MKRYRSKFNHPKWQKVMFAVLENANWKCVDCGEDNIELHAQHTFNDSRENPWDYPIDSIKCLCDGCYSTVREQNREQRYQIYKKYLDRVTYVKSIKEKTFFDTFAEHHVGWNERVVLCNICKTKIISLYQFEEYGSCYGCWQTGDHLDKKNDLDLWNRICQKIVNPSIERKHPNLDEFKHIDWEEYDMWFKLKSGKLMSH